ncbi:hypothetical protein GCM10025867_29560 [Frondihabitans sucicola]|uniref:Pyridoxamine kinase/Phosphomethylpyrimidine kinase domain-containing protein n=1 Tax=Frondihabitans sucicola TaxID=1268041 RepID=A0ABM8GQI3_9MICO|nr:hypothetical protein GCM10025867_29560 [Frondihabitans sucicola]
MLVGPEGTRRFDGPRIATANTHGTGCSLSSAIAANRAAGSTWPDAVAAAKSWLSEALRTSDRLDVGAGHGPVNHFHALWQEASS